MTLFLFLSCHVSRKAKKNVRSRCGTKERYLKLKARYLKLLFKGGQYVKVEKTISRCCQA